MPAVLAYGFVLSYLPPSNVQLLILLNLLKSNDMELIAASLRSLVVISKTYILPLEVTCFFVYRILF